MKDMIGLLTFLAALVVCFLSINIWIKSGETTTRDKLPNRVILTTKYASNREFLCIRDPTEGIRFICEELPLP